VFTTGDRVELTETLDQQTIWTTPPGLRGTVVRQHRMFAHLALLVRFDGQEASRWVRAHDLRLLCVVERVAELEV
jgi:hypothetical protein